MNKQLREAYRRQLYTLLEPVLEASRWTKFKRSVRRAMKKVKK